MRFVSLFSGIEAASVALCPKGWECVAVAEVDKAASKVLARLYPDVPNLGDVTKITEAQVMAWGHVDVIIFGSPCQDLSVAGKRGGLAGARSGLFHTAIEIIAWARQHCGLRWAVWENVPGAFSSHKGADFAVVVGAMAGCDDVDVPAHGWGSEGCAVGDLGLVEWAVLDAQWFGLAQRRKRVFAVADFGNWPGRPPILLERQSLRGDPPTRRSSREDLAGVAAEGVGGGGGRGVGLGVAPTLNAGGHSRNPLDEPLLPISYGFTSKDYGQDAAADLAPTLRAGGHTDSHENGGVSPAIAFALRGREGGAMPEGFNPMASALRAASGGSTRDYVAFDTTQLTHPENRSNPQPGDPCHPLAAQGHAPAVTDGWAVRRLTPTECERLQGFEDGHTAGQADGPRYKQLGNSMATPCIAWIGERIMLAELVS